MARGVLEIFRSEKDRQWYWRIKAANGKIIAQSEGYRQKRSAERGLAAVGMVFGRPGVEYRVCD